MVAFDDRVHVDLYRFTDAGMVGSIGLVAPDGEARVVAAELALPNGLVVTTDGSTLLASESDGERVLAFTIDNDGGLFDQRGFAALPGRKPDGRTLYLVINETTIDGFLNGESVGRFEVARVDVPARAGRSLRSS